MKVNREKRDKWGKKVNRKLENESKQRENG